MNKKIETSEGIAELDERLVKLIKAESYESEKDYCINTRDIEENENDTSTCLEDDEILALYIQQNGFGDIKKAQIEILQKLNKETAKLTVYEAGNTGVECVSKSEINALIKSLCEGLKS